MARQLGYGVGNTNGARDFSGKEAAAAGGTTFRQIRRRSVAALRYSGYLVLALMIEWLYGLH